MLSRRLAFRQLLYNFSQELSKEECQVLVYIKLYDCRERYQDASNLDVLSRLEEDRVFSHDNPSGLIEVAKDIHRADLVNLVEKFMKRSKDEKVKAETPERSCFRLDSCAQLRTTLEETLSQVIEQLVRDILQQWKEQIATEARKEAERAVKKLAQHLQKVQEHLEPSSQRSSTSSKEYESGEGHIHLRIVGRAMSGSCNEWLVCMTCGSIQ